RRPRTRRSRQEARVNPRPGIGPWTGEAAASAAGAEPGLEPRIFGRVAANRAPLRLLRRLRRRVYTQERIDRADTRDGGLERAEGQDRSADQTPVPLVDQGQPRVQNREGEEGKPERRRAIPESAHREQGPHVHHHGAQDPGEKPQRLEERVERRQAAQERERAGHDPRVRVQIPDVDRRLGHWHPPVKGSPSTIIKERRGLLTRWRPPSPRGSIEQTPTSGMEAVPWRPSAKSSARRAARSSPFRRRKRLSRPRNS